MSPETEADPPSRPVDPDAPGERRSEQADNSREDARTDESAAPRDAPRARGRPGSKAAREAQEVRLRRSDVVAAAWAGAKAGGYEDATDYIEDLIRADRRGRGAGLRLARGLGDVGLLLSELVEIQRARGADGDALEATLGPLVERLVAFVAERVGPVEIARAGPDEAAGATRPSARRRGRPP